MPGGPGAPATPVSPYKEQTDINICKGLANLNSFIICALLYLLYLLVNHRYPGYRRHPVKGRKSTLKTSEWTIHITSSIPPLVHVHNRHTFSPFCPGGPGNPMLPDSPCKHKVSVYNERPVPVTRKHAGRPVTQATVACCHDVNLNTV